MVTYRVEDVSPDMSFLEMLDVLNEQLIREGEEPVAFDHDCREGICGACGLVINGMAHGPEQAPPPASCTCGTSPTATPSTSSRGGRRRFPVVKDLVVDRGAFDRIIQAGGYISAPTGPRPTRTPPRCRRRDADPRLRRRPCIGCGACVAACPNGSAMLFTAARRSPTSALLPQGQPEREPGSLDMVDQHDAEGFGGCTNTGECTAVCPKGIPLDTISRPTTTSSVHSSIARTDTNGAGNEWFRKCS